MASSRAPLEEKAAAIDNKTSTPSSIKELLTCPVTLELFFAPVTLGCGHSVEEEAFQKLQNPECPVCRDVISDDFDANVNITLRNLVIETIRADKSLLKDQYFSVEIWKKILKKETSYEFLAELLSVKELNECWHLIENYDHWCSLFLKDDYFLIAVDEVITHNPTHVSALAFQASARLLKRDFSGAIEAATLALDLNSNYAFAYSNRAAVHLYLNHFDEAMADATHLLRLNSYKACAYSILAAVYLEQKDFYRATVAATAACKLDATDLYAKDLLTRAQNKKMRLMNHPSVNGTGFFAGGTDEKKEEPKKEAGVQRRACVKK